jgi:hypothetical protein
MSGMGTHEVVNLIKSSAYWETILKLAKEFCGVSNSEAMALAKQWGLQSSRSNDAGIVLEPWVVEGPNGFSVLVSLEVSRQRVKVSVDTPRGNLKEVTAVIGDEIREHFERSEGKPQPCPWCRSELRGLIAQIRELYRARVVDGPEPRVENTETRAGHTLSLVARPFRRTRPMQLVLTLYPSESDAWAQRVFDPTTRDALDAETLQSWINDCLAPPDENSWRSVPTRYAGAQSGVFARCRP